VLELPPIVSAAGNVAVWLCWSLAVGYIGHRRPPRSFAMDRWWSRLRRFESGGSWYARTLHIKTWKDRLPELGGLFAGGFAKRGAARDREYLERFVIETRRAEWVHWAAFLLWPVFGLWNPPWAVAVMFVYATVVNAPCLVVQRYNRARLLHALALLHRRDLASGPRPARAASRPHGSGGIASA
jgi:glycosyl-4,4'-diaponeurosporenoate acyltransferase